MKLSIRYRSCACGIFEYLFALALVLNCRTIWTSVPSMIWFNLAVFFMLCLSVAGAFLCGQVYERIKLTNFGVITLAVLLYAGVFLLVNHINAASFLKFIVSVLFIMLYCYVCSDENSRKTILYKYENIVFCICIVSLAFWIVCSLLSWVGRTGVVISDWTGQEGVTKSVASYYGLYFETQKTAMIIRNSAIFTEAPMCSLQFCTAYLVELFMKETPKKSKVIILGIGIVSTISTTGYIVLLVALILRYIISKPKLKLVEIIRVVVIPLVLLVGVIVAYEIIMRKLAQGTSGSTRIDDFKAGFKAWADSPFWGNGFNNDASYRKYMTWSARAAGNAGFSNSLMAILAFGGIYLLLPYAVSLYRGIKNCIRFKQKNVLCFLLLFALMFSVTLIPFQYLSIYLFTALSCHDFYQEDKD